MSAVKDLTWCLISLVIGSGIVKASDSFSVQCAEGVITARPGSSVVLPCWLSPQLNAENLEIRWYRPNKFTVPLLYYEKGEIKTNLEDAMYRNRSALTVSNAQSTGLKQGDVSLRLGNINFLDNGIFHCYVSGDSAYNSNIVTLNVNAIGSPPVLSLQLHEYSVNVTCSSCGWFPKPHLIWESVSDSRAVPLHPQSLLYRNESGGLFCVDSWILVSSSISNLISCSISLSREEKREVSMDVRGLTQLPVCNEGLWKTLFALAFFITLAMIGISVFLYRKYKTGYMRTKTDEEEPQAGNLTPRVKETVFSGVNMEDLRKKAVRITLDQTRAHPDLKLNRNCDFVRDNGCKKYTEFPYELCVPGTTSFSGNDCVYWEVKLKSHNVPAKQSWLIGIANASYSVSNNPAHFIPSNGFWFLRSDLQGVNNNTIPQFWLNTRPESVGVLLDHKNGELSFYDATKAVLLFTIKTHFTEKVVPLFNPGIGEGSPLQILYPQNNSQTNPEVSANAQANDTQQHE